MMKKDIHGSTQARWRFCLMLVMLMTCGNAVNWAQSTQGVILGTVKDTEGALVPGPEMHYMDARLDEIGKLTCTRLLVDFQDVTAIGGEHPRLVDVEAAVRHRRYGAGPLRNDPQVRGLLLQTESQGWRGDANVHLTTRREQRHIPAVERVYATEVQADRAGVQ